MIPSRRAGRSPARLLSAAILLLGASAGTVRADDARKPSPPAAAGAAVPPPPAVPTRNADENPLLDLLPADSVTRHAFTAPGVSLGYTATAGTLTLRDDDGKPSARMFYVSYVADNQPVARRPVSFFFNGGPGAGSAFLHLGAAGPVALNFPAANPTDGAGATLAPNPDSWLRFTDMVFVDAVGTGYSLPAHPDKAGKEFYGVAADGRSFAQFIRLWLERNAREPSPKYLVGESYGGVRSLSTAWALQTVENIPPTGIVMVSPAIEMNLLTDPDNPISDAILLPSLAASSLELQHRLTPGAVQAAYDYSFGSYLSTLAGAPPTGDAAAQFYDKVAQVTGLPVSVVAKERGQLDPQAHDVRSRDGRLYSLYDGTVSIADPYPEGINGDDSPEPVLRGYGLAYGNAFTGYVGQALNWHTPLRYDLLNLKVNKDWNYRGEKGDLVARTMPELRKLLALDPSLRVFIANGYFDLTCPFSGSRWLIEHMPVGRDRVRLKVYPGGHMLYTRPDSRAALSHDVAALYTVTP